MTSMFIGINGSATRGNAQLRGNIDNLQHYMDDVRRMRAVFDAASNGADWTGLGAMLGISATDAETVYNLFVGLSNDLLALGSITQYLSRLG